MRILPLSDTEVTCLQQVAEPAFRLTYCDSKSSALFALYVIYLSIDKGFPGNSAGKESACNAGDPSSVPGLGRSPGEGNGYPLQYYCLGNSMDCVLHGVTKSWTGLSDFHFHFKGKRPWALAAEKPAIKRHLCGYYSCVTLGSHLMSLILYFRICNMVIIFNRLSCFSDYIR